MHESFESISDLKEFLKDNNNCFIHCMEEYKVSFDYFEQYLNAIMLIGSIDFDCVVEVLKVLNYTFISIEELVVRDK